MKGIVITNAFYLNDSVKYQLKRFEEEFEKENIEFVHKTTTDFFVKVEDGEIKTNLESADFIIYLDKDIHIAKMLEKLGYRLFNASESIYLCDDKMLTHIALANNNIAMPKTISSPLMYVLGDDEKFIQSVMANFSFPLVCKNVYGSLGKQVYLIKNEEELRTFREENKFTPHIYQEFIRESKGEDIRVITVGGKAVASMKRKAVSDFRSNIALGGKAEKFEISSEIKELVERAVKVLSLDYAGVDVIIGKNDVPMILEVNSNAFFEGVEGETNQNIANIYVKHIKNSIK